MASSLPPPLPASLHGTLHVFVAFDWGDEIDLERVRKLVPSEALELQRRRRTPTSIAFRPPPLRLPLALSRPPIAELAGAALEAEVTLFDFAAVGVAVRAPLALAPEAWISLAGRLTDTEPLVSALRDALRPLFDRLQPAIARPRFGEPSEEYFVFEFSPEAGLPPPTQLIAEHSAWLAGLLRLEAEPLSGAEVAEAVRMSLTYTPRDLFLAEWSAAVLVDSECRETLQTIEFVNVQLLEYRDLDNRLDDRLAETYRLIQPLARGRLPFWRNYARTQRALGELRVEANSLFERTGNVLKLVGDQYLARVYRLLAARFHLETWEANVRRSLETIEGAYEVVSDQSVTYRSELLEIIIVLLILFEIVMALVRG